MRRDAAAEFPNRIYIFLGIRHRKRLFLARHCFRVSPFLHSMYTHTHPFVYLMLLARQLLGTRRASRIRMQIFRATTETRDGRRSFFFFFREEVLPGVTFPPVSRPDVMSFFLPILNMVQSADACCFSWALMVITDSL